MLLGDAQQGLGRSARLPAALLPVLDGAHTDAHQAGKGRLLQIELSADRLGRRWRRQRARAQINLACLVSLDFLDSVQYLLSDVALRHLRSPWQACHNREGTQWLCYTALPHKTPNLGGRPSVDTASLAAAADLRYNGGVIGGGPVEVPLPKFHFVMIGGCG